VWSSRRLAESQTGMEWNRRNRGRRAEQAKWRGLLTFLEEVEFCEMYHERGRARK
jgi:hypothetical protein